VLNSAITATSFNTNNAIVCQDSGGKCTVTEVYGDINTASTTLNIGTINANTVNIVTGTAQVVNVETGSKTTTINLGGAGNTVNVASTLTYINTSNLEITNNTITINEGGETESTRVNKVLQLLLESVTVFDPKAVPNERVLPLKERLLAVLIVIRLVIVLLKVLQLVLVSAPEVEPDVVPSERVLSLR